jgi:hypothetical protein
MSSSRADLSDLEAAMHGVPREILLHPVPGQTDDILVAPIFTRKRALQHHSKSASVENAAVQTLRHLEPIFVLRCAPLGTMTYS